MFGCTHSHSAPDTQGLWGKIPDDYRSRIISLGIDAIATAYESRVPASLSVASGQADNHNRRGIYTITDQMMNIIDATDKATGARIATFVNFPAHPTSVDEDNLEISSDWWGFDIILRPFATVFINSLLKSRCGYMRDTLEGLTGAPVLYSNGIQGDVAPEYMGFKDGFDAASAYGTYLAQTAFTHLTTSVALDGDISLRTLPWTHRMTGPLFYAAYEIGLLTPGYPNIGHDADGKMTVNTQFSYWTVGDMIQGVTFPGEALTRFVRCLVVDE